MKAMPHLKFPMRMISKSTLMALGLAAAAWPAQALIFEASLDGPSEFPNPVASPGTGTSTVWYNPTTHILSIEIDWVDLVGLTTVAHIHGPTAVAGTGGASVMTTTPSFPDFPAGVTAGSYARTFDMTAASSYNPAFLNNAVNGGSTASAEATLAAALLDGKAYVNVHSSFVGSGEIRGFYKLVPDAGSTAALLLFGLGGLATLARRQEQ